VTPAPRTRRRLSRTFSASRFPEYGELLKHAIARGYRILELEEWIDAPDATKPPILILRHDVDQHPRSVRPMLAAERDLDLRSTWYFRWRTADPTILAEVRAAGGSVGLHYETLTRIVLRRGGNPQVEDLIAEARRGLHDEIACFRDRLGPIRSISPHGDTRVPGVSNVALVEGIDPAELDVDYDGSLAVRRRALGCWLTDRSTAEGRWRDEVNPLRLLDELTSPILCLTHPNNWASGPGLWADRLLGAAIPAAWGARPPIRTVADDPPCRPDPRRQPAS
jgi:hypothetical protein